MTNTEIIKILNNELECIKRANYCNRKCETCDLVLEDTKLITAYEKAIHIITNSSKYCKSVKRFKRKYVFLKLAIKRAMKEIDNMIDADCYEEYQLQLRNGLVYAYNILNKHIKTLL